MRKRKITVIALVVTVLFAATFTVVSCKKSRGSNSEQPVHSTNTLRIFGKNYTPSVCFSIPKAKNNDSQKRSANVSLSYGKVQVELDEIESVYNDLREEFGSDLLNADNILAMVLYTSVPFEPIETSDLMGFSVVTSSEGQLQHKMYSVRDGILEEDIQFNAFFNSYDMRDFSLLLDYFRPTESLDRSFLMLTSPQFNAFTAKGKAPKFLTINLIENQIMYRPVPDKNQCESCYGDSKDESCVKDENGEEHCTGGCMSTAMIVLGKKYEKPTNIPLDHAYNFRDFMANYKKGREYTLYYYKISYVIGGLSLIDKSNFDENLAFMMIVYDLADKIQFGDDNEVVVNQEVAAVLVSKANSYIGRSNNEEFNEILQRIKTDVIHFTNKTRTEILQEWN